MGPLHAVQAKSAKILVLFNTQEGGTLKMAQAVAEGIESVEGARAVLKRIPSQSKANDKYPVTTVEELADYDGLAIGSPVHFGNMSADMRVFLDKTIPLWTAHKLEGVPATVFMSAGSGAGRELALQSFWTTLAMHGMILVPTGIMGAEKADKTTPQGNTVLGATALMGMPGDRPSNTELNLAKLQGRALARVALALSGSSREPKVEKNSERASADSDIEKNLKKLGLTLPEAPKPVGNYKPFVISGKQVFINQVALNKDGKISTPGKVGKEVTLDQAKAATRQTMLNIVAVLKDAVGGDWSRVKQCVQLTGIFNAPPEFNQHALLMNEASNLSVEIFGEAGKHARATVGAASLPVDSPVEIQAVFEIE